MITNQLAATFTTDLLFPSPSNIGEVGKSVSADRLLDLLAAGIGTTTGTDLTPTSRGGVGGACARDSSFGIVSAVATDAASSTLLSVVNASALLAAVSCSASDYRNGESSEGAYRCVTPRSGRDD